MHKFYWNFILEILLKFYLWLKKIFLYKCYHHLLFVTSTKLTSLITEIFARNVRCCTLRFRSVLVIAYTAKNAPVVTMLLQACYKLVGIWRQSEINAHVVIRCRDRLVARCLQTCNKLVITDTQQLPPTRLYQAFLATL